MARIIGVVCSLIVALALAGAARAGDVPTRAGSFNSAGVKIAYIEAGQGPPVVLIHGLASSAGINWVLPGTFGLLARQFHVVALDLRGHGLSDKPAAEADYGQPMVDDVVRLMDHLQIAKAHIVGYSLGGIIAMKFIVDYPERVLSCNLGGMGYLRHGSFEEGIFKGWGDRASAGTAAACLHGIARLAVSAAQVRAVRLPVEMLVGDRDPCRTMYVEPLKPLHPEWPIVVIRGAGHINCIVKEQYKSEVVKWIAGQAAAAAPFALGADISWVPAQEEEGRHFSDRGSRGDILAILRGRGFNAIRLRIFNNPAADHGYSRQGYCDLEHTLAMARRIKAAGMEFLLDFHYSDTWADPKHQTKPAAWADLHGAELERALHDYTQAVLLALQKQGTPPQIVQIGNEVSNGMLWPDGEMYKSGRWDVLCGLLKAGAGAVREVDPGAKIMVHLAHGGQNAQSRAFLDQVIAGGVVFDIIGQSYYPQWHGTLADLKANLTDLAGRYRQSIMVVEYSTPNVQEINEIVRGLPEGKGLGTFIWEPTRWNGPALFDNQGNSKAEIEVYGRLAGAGTTAGGAGH